MEFFEQIPVQSTGDFYVLLLRKSRDLNIEKRLNPQLMS